MNIGTLAKRSGRAFADPLLRARGDLKTVQRKANGYRSYPEETLVVLGLITTAQAAGFSLEEISSLLPSDLNHWDRQTLLTTLQQKSRISKSWNRNSRTVKRNWSTLSMRYNRSRMIDCAANARRVLTEVLDVQHQTGRKNNYQPFTASPLYNSSAALATSSVW